MTKYKAYLERCFSDERLKRAEQIFEDPRYIFTDEERRVCLQAARAFRKWSIASRTRHGNVGVMSEGVLQPLLMVLERLEDEAQ